MFFANSGARRVPRDLKTGPEPLEDLARDGRDLVGGIHVPAKNKWLSIIHNASRHYRAPHVAMHIPA